MKQLTYKISLVIALAVFALSGNAQNVGINSTGAAPNNSAMLDVSSTSLGLLVPRMTNAQMNAIVAPATSLIVYNTTANCFYFYTGAMWQVLACVCVSPTPGAISGPLVAGINTCNNIYSIAPVPGATGYMWKITPSGGGTSIQSGQGTPTINACFGPTIQSYTICVYDSSLTCAKSATSCLVISTTNCLHGTINFSYTGAAQTWTVPACITQVTVTLKGGSGGCGGASSYSPTQDSGGLGGVVTGVLAVVPGAVLQVNVGGAGVNGTPAGGGAGGWNGGGQAGAGYSFSNPYIWWGGGGGGASDIRVTPYALANRTVVAGGGGGAGFNYFACCNYDRGGMGGGTTGGCGWSGNVLCGGTGPGQGGSQVGGGLNGNWPGYCTASPGVLGIGGDDIPCSPNDNAGGGGGGGYYGGGGGDWSGGGGGSSYVTGLLSVSVNAQNVNPPGNGNISITY